MPPKKGGNVSKDKQKIVEDKTFGMKNKNKSAKVKAFVQTVQKQVAEGGKQSEKAKLAEKERIAAKKKAEEDRKAELNELFKVVQTQQKIPFGVDPKSILCSFFKTGTCTKGHKCKFSHDLNVERKGAKVDIYSDSRGDVSTKNDDTMENWDQAKLEEAVKKHIAADNRNKPTDIVCKFFLDAIDSRKYGWFWTCPNGDTCKYRHALPPGFVLKKKETTEERLERERREKENEITIEDFLEKERHALGSNLTPVNAETFAQWKKDRVSREELEMSTQARKKQEAFNKMKAGMKTGMAFSGKDLFDFNPDWAADQGDDDDAMEFYERDDISVHSEDEPTAPADEMELSRSISALNVDEDLFDGIEVGEESEGDDN